MRRTFAKLILEKVSQDDRIIVATGDLGYGMWDELRASFPDNFYNVGSAEQLLLGIGIGLAEDGKIPILYSITPFLLCRPFELIRSYINHENIPVKLTGSGRDRDYSHDGFTHWAEDHREIVSIFNNVSPYYPDEPAELEEVFLDFLYSPEPSYLNLKR